jgi:serine/threonine-protein kinase
VYPTIPASHGELVDSRYRLERLVGEGASSWVFAATDQRLEREVALKLFKPPSCKDDVKRRRRFIAEGRTLAKLVHPHIVAIHDASEDSSGQAYLVMELCEAGTLEAELAQRGRLDLVETLQLVLPLMGALAFAHDRNVVHRDLKPGNIVLVEERGERRCKLLDFGISLAAGVRISSDLGLGTPAYMAPEQVRGEPTTPATDVWALGVVLFRCLTGRLPFEASNSASMLLQVLHGRAPRLSSICDPKLAPRVMLVLDRALEPSLQRRHRDVRSFARALATTCALDDVAVMQRPEPIGLPEFDAWLLAAKASPMTEPMRVAPLERSAAWVAEESRRPRWGVRVALAAAVVGLIAGGVLTLWNAPGRSQASAGTRTALSPRSPASVMADVARPAVPEGPPASHSALPPQAEPAALTLPEATKPHPVESPKRRKADQPRARIGEPAAQAPAPAPRVIMSWDW